MIGLLLVTPAQCKVCHDIWKAVLLSILWERRNDGQKKHYIHYITRVKLSNFAGGRFHHMNSFRWYSPEASLFLVAVGIRVN